MSDWNTPAAQRVIGRDLIPTARSQQGAVLPQEEALPLALELYWTALSMTPEHHAAGVVVANRFAARMGLDPEAVEAFAIHSVREAIEKETP